MQAKKGFKNMKIIATSDELKDLRNLFIQGFTSLDDKDRTELEDKIKDLESDPRLSTGFDDFIEGFKEDVTCDLKKELEILKTDYASLLTDKEEFKKNVDYWKSEHGDKVLEIEKLDSRISDLIDCKYELETKIKELEKTLTYWHSQSKELALAKNPNQELINSNQILKKAVDNLMEVIDLKEIDIKNLVKNNQELKTELFQSKKELEYLKTNTKDIFTMPKDNSIKEMFTGVATPGGEMYYKYKLDNNDLSSENSIGTIYGNPLNLELQRECIQLKEKNKELVAEYESLEQKKINLEVENENLNSELNDIKQVLKQSNTELKDELNLKNEVLELQAKVFKLQETNNKLNQDNQRLDNENNNLGTKLIQLNSDNSILKEMIETLQQTNNKLSKEIESLNLENSKVYHRNKELEEASKKFIDLNTKLNFDVKNLSEYKTIKDKEFDNLSKSFDELWNDRDELRKAGSRMKKELEIAYSLAELRLKEINGLINNKVEIIRVLDKYAGDTQPGTKYININVLKDIKQYL